MTDNELLLAISNILDEKLEEKLEQKLEEKLEQKLEEKLDKKLEEKLDKKLEEKLDARLAPIERRLKRIEVDLLENNVLPRLNTIEACYVDTYNRYKSGVDKMQAAFEDISLLKKVVAEHSTRLQAMSS